jgi:hypothetical protein
VFVHLWLLCGILAYQTQNLNELFVFLPRSHWVFVRVAYITTAMKFIPIAVILLLLTGAFTSSCRHYPTAPNDSTKCDTCCDTCHKPCDTCNLNKDSLAHAFEWTEYTIPGESNLTGCWVFGDTDIRIIGNYFYKFNGAAIQKINAFDLTHNVTMGGALNGFNIFGFDKDDYWLVHGSEALHSSYDGVFEDFRFGAVNACWGPSSTDMFFVGNGGQIHHYDGTKFTDMVSGTTKDLRSVWGTSHNDVWACGYNTSSGETILLHYDGSNWQEDNISVANNNITDGFNAVWACDSAGHKFVSTSGATLIRKTDNGVWRSDGPNIPNNLGGGSYIGIALKGNTPNDMFMYGPWGMVAHWNGKSWKKFDQLYDYNNQVYYSSAFSVKGNIACVVGTKSGQSWIAIGRRKQ